MFPRAVFDTAFLGTIQKNGPVRDANGAVFGIMRFRVHHSVNDFDLATVTESALRILACQNQVHSTKFTESGVVVLVRNASIAAMIGTFCCPEELYM